MNPWGPAILSSGVVGAMVPLLMAWMNRRQAKALAHKTDAERADVLAAAQQKAQETALKAADYRYGQVKAACDECLGQLVAERAKRDQDRLTLDALLDALIEVVPLLDADTEATSMLRAAIATARRSRYHE